MLINPTVNSAPPHHVRHMSNGSDDIRQERSGHEYIRPHERDRSVGHRQHHLIANSIMHMQGVIRVRSRRKVQLGRWATRWSAIVKPCVSSETTGHLNRSCAGHAHSWLLRSDRDNRTNTYRAAGTLLRQGNAHQRRRPHLRPRRIAEQIDLIRGRLGNQLAPNALEHT